MATAENEGRARIPVAGTLANAFQEPLTACVRIKDVGQRDFRTWIEQEIANSVQQAVSAGYSEQDAEHAKFALVAFVDEAVRYSHNQALANWTSLQGQVYRTEDAGETFFTRLAEIQKRGDTPQTADLLEVFVMCLLLGFKGQYRLMRSASAENALDRTKDKVIEQIRRIRVGLEHPRPWRIPAGQDLVVTVDPWVRRLRNAAVVLFVALVVVYAAFYMSLGSRLDDTVTALRGVRLS